MVDNVLEAFIMPRILTASGVLGKVCFGFLKSDVPAIVHGVIKNDSASPRKFILDNFTIKAHAQVVIGDGEFPVAEKVFEHESCPLSFDVYIISQD